MDALDAKYPQEHPRFQNSLQDMTQMEVNLWLEDTPPPPSFNEAETYESFMQRQVFYTKYCNAMINARDEYAKNIERLSIEAPPVGEDIRAVLGWVQRTGETPIEFLAKTYRSNSAKTGDRISAARALLDYVHRKMPQVVESKDEGLKEEVLKEQIEIIKRIEEVLSEKIQQKKMLQRIK